MQKFKISSISVVSPVYRAEGCLHELYERLTATLSRITDNYQIILVINDICKSDARIIGLNLSRNFGQHYAISAGLEYATKDWIIVMDCDLQDQPEEIEKFIEPASKGYKTILAQRAVRQDSLFKRISSKVFYKLLAYLTGSNQDSSVANFGLYHKDVIRSIISSKESIRYFPTLVQWVGFKKTKVSVEHAPRRDGESSYNFKRLILLAIDIILAYSDKPLRLVVKLGISISFLSFLFAGYVFINAIQGNYAVIGYASLMTSIWLLAGIIIFVLGIIGLYLGKTFEQSKNRPVYIIAETINLNETHEKH
jgi:glycosyltransferase involved in cell wall biosynthesis